MTTSDARSWMAGWRALEDRERDELRKGLICREFEALAFLMASADLFDLSQLDSEDAIARARWARLQSLLLDRTATALTDASRVDGASALQSLA